MKYFGKLVTRYAKNAVVEDLVLDVLIKRRKDNGKIKK
jgi:hypothetical protein